MVSQGTFLSKCFVPSLVIDTGSKTEDGRKEEEEKKRNAEEGGVAKFEVN